MENNKLKKALRTLRIKMITEAVIKNVLIGIISGTGFSLCVITAAKFMFIPDLMLIIIYSICGGTGLALIYTVIRKLPHEYAVAEAADSLGYKQRFVTALELLNDKRINKSQISALVIEDAVFHAENADFRKLYKLKAPKKNICILLVMLVSAMVLVFVPGPNDDALEEYAVFREKIAIEAEKIKTTANSEAEFLTEKDAEQIRLAVNELIKELKKSKTEAEAVRNMQKTQEELKKLANNSVSKDLKALGDKFLQNEAMAALGESLQRGDTEEIKQNMEALAERLSSISEAAEDAETHESAKNEINKIVENLNELGNEISENPELAKLFDELSEALSAGALGDLDAQLSAIQRSLSEAAAKNEALRSAINNLNSALSESGKKMGRQSGESTASKSEEAAQNTTDGENSADSQNSQPTGDKTSQQSGSAAAGEQSGANPSGSGRGSGHLENENIYSRDAAVLGDKELIIQGETTDAGSMTNKFNQGFGTNGGSLPYREALENYKDEALRSLDDNEIPFGLREIIKEYFSSLE